MGPISRIMVRPTISEIYDSAPNCTMVSRSRSVSTSPIMKPVMPTSGSDC